MHNNITREDLDALIAYLQQDEPDADPVAPGRGLFEQEWSAWLGVKHSVFVNSGSSANLLTMAALRETFGLGEVIVPTLTWVSDIASVLQCGFKPVFVDINPRTLGMDDQQVLARITPQTRAVFLTHVLGYNALTQRLLDELKARNIPLIEDVCESHGATFNGRKLGTFRAHVELLVLLRPPHEHHRGRHDLAPTTPTSTRRLRMFRSHGMVRGVRLGSAQEPSYRQRVPGPQPRFHFRLPGL